MIDINQKSIQNISQINNQNLPKEKSQTREQKQILSTSNEDKQGALNNNELSLGLEKLGEYNKTQIYFDKNKYKNYTALTNEVTQGLSEMLNNLAQKIN